MKKIIKELLFFSTPFIFYALAIIIMDPYNYLGVSSVIPPSKRKVAEQIQPHLFKLIEFTRSPKHNIALGDSRTNALFHSVDLGNYYDLAYGGGSLNEVIKTFWYVTDKVELDTVIIGINFNLYNKYNTRFWVEETIERKKNFFSYAFNNYTYQSAFKILRTTLFDEQSEIGKPEMTKEEFWDYQIRVTAEKFYSQYLYPDNYFNELKRISDYCKAKGIHLMIWIPPTHIEFQNRINDFSLSEEQERFKRQLQQIADVYDFDFDSELTRDSSNFKDPLHFTDEVGNQIYREIFKRQLKYARYTRHGSN
jgi:hypothetical protein